MSSRHLVDPQTLPLMDAFSLGDLSDATLPDIRTQITAKVQLPDANAAGLSAVELRIPGESGSPDVRVLVYDPGPGTRLRPAILHIHAGGYILGTPDANHAANQVWAAALGALVVSVDYRLAPEHPFPAALDDCHAALRWLHLQAGERGLDTKRIAVMGESAGGGLAANLALRARDTGTFPVAFQMLAYPMLDDRTGVDETLRPLAGEFMWTAAYNRYAWQKYLGRAAAEAPPPYAAAARAADLRGLPPCFISIGALDLFFDENMAYAGRLIAAGVPMELHVYPGGVHAFDLIPNTDIGAVYARQRVEAMRRALETTE